MTARIYMDHHATTPVDPRVLDAMLPYFSERFGNAASRTHVYGWEAEDAVEAARRQIADTIGARPQEIVFTSGATEANNLVLKGLLAPGDHAIVSAIEHRAILDPAKRLAVMGVDVTIIPVSNEGSVNPDDVAGAITERTKLISIMTANNEIGTIQPIRAIGQFAHDRGVLFHTDAVQAIGRIPVNVDDAHIDLLSMSAHKIYGPKGIGALYVRRRRPRIELTPLIDGGGHEHGLRSGTLPVPLIVGFGFAVEFACANMAKEATRVEGLRNRLQEQIFTRIPDCELNGSATHRLPNNLNVSFMGTDSESVLTEMRDVALSAGSACSSAEPESSHVLRALGLREDRIKSAIRFGLGRSNTREEVDTVVEKLALVIQRLRSASPLYRMKQQEDTPVDASRMEHPAASSG